MSVLVRPPQRDDVGVLQLGQSLLLRLQLPVLVLLYGEALERGLYSKYSETVCMARPLREAFE